MIKIWFNKTFQNSRHNLSENELRSLFVAKVGEAFSYPASSTIFVLVMQNFLIILHYFKKFTQAFYIITQKLVMHNFLIILHYFKKFTQAFLHNYTKIMLLGFRIFKNVPSVSEASDSFQKCYLSAWKNLFMP